MAGVQGAKCCCNCWYRILKCACEEDAEQFPIFVQCQMLEDLLEGFPDLGGHVVFEFFDGVNDLCYDAKADPNLKVGTIPDGGFVLPEPPPIDFPPPNNNCAACCPSNCCGPCWRNPNAQACCFCPGDLMEVFMHKPGYTSRVCCGGNVVTCVTTCSAKTFTARYILLDDCESWFRYDGDPCMWSGLCLTCWPGGYECCPAIPPGCKGVGVGWHNTENEFCQQDCAQIDTTNCNCQTLDPCVGLPQGIPVPPPPPGSDDQDICAANFVTLGCQSTLTGCGNDQFEFNYVVVTGRRLPPIGCEVTGDGFGDEEDPGGCLPLECPHR